MSFSALTKNELARVIGSKDCCKKAELIALVKMNGSLRISRGRISVEIRCHNAAVARKVFSLVKKLFGISTEIVVRRKVRLRKNNVYLIRIPPQENIKDILLELGIIDRSYSFQRAIPSLLTSRECCRRSSLRGLFLAAGSISNPDKAYHMEITTDNLQHVKDIKRLLKSFDLPGKVSSRKSLYVVYLKDSEQMAKLLNIMGAHNALLEFESKRVYKDVRNQVNRLVNCETANLNKTVEAAIRQVEDINLIARVMGMNKLPQALRLTAEARLQYPDASLRELGELVNPPVGKSGMNHRFRKLSKIAEQLRKKN